MSDFSSSRKKDENIPASVLIQQTQEAIDRINNEDRRRLESHLQRSGHLHTLQSGGPLILWRFLRAEINLDGELSVRQSHAPLLSSIKLRPKRPRADDIYMLATLSSQDDAARMSIDINKHTNHTDISFTLNNMLTLRFSFDEIDEEERREALELMRREQGITFFWTTERWEQDYMIFIAQEFFVRMYVYSARGYEAACRLTKESNGSLVDWLERIWFPRVRGRKRARVTTTVEKPALDQPHISPSITSIKRIVQKLEEERKKDDDSW